jgi:hypothetical protein
MLAYEREKWTERLLMWIAWHLPRRLVGYCYVRVATEASVGEFRDREMGTITAVEAYISWLKKYEPGELEELC